MTGYEGGVALDVIWGYSAYKKDQSCVNEEGPASFIGSNCGCL